MNRHKGVFLVSSAIVAALLFAGIAQAPAQQAAPMNMGSQQNSNGNGSMKKMNRMTNDERWKAAIRNADRRADHKRHQKGGK